MSSPPPSYAPPATSETATTRAAGVVQELRGQPADLAEALHRDGGAARVDAGLPQRAERRVHHAAAGRAAAPLGAADGDRLAGDHAGDRVAGVDGVGVHHPGHGLLVGADVRRRDVLLRADDRQDLRDVAAGHPLQLVAGQRLGVDRDAALRPAVRHADQRALPGHPHRQRADLVEVGGRVEADAALGRAAGQVVLDPVAAQHLDVPVVVPQRDRDRDLAPRRAQQLVEAVVEAELADRLGELVLGGLPRGHPCSHEALPVANADGRR